MNMKTKVNKTEPTAICNGCGVGMSDLEIEYITEDGFEYCSDCNAAIQADDESSGRLEKKQQAVLLLGRELTKSESGLLALFMNDGDYEMYMDASNNLAYRKCYEIGTSVFITQIKSHGVITLKENSDYYVELSDGHGAWFSHKEFK